jgi:molybdopterin converting factor small subunit
MQVQVQFFSNLKELAGASTRLIEIPEGSRVSDLLDVIYAHAPALRACDKSILIGAGVEFVERDYALRPNEDIAIMPPVQGG